MSKFDKFLMETAKVWSKASSCKKRQVGAVIAKDTRVIAIGYNGTLPGFDNACEDNELVCIDCGTATVYDEVEDSGYCHTCRRYAYTIIKSRTKESVIHAEQNALMNALKNGISTNGSSMYITTAPCVNYSKLMISAGVKEVVYLEDYKTDDGIELLNESGVKTKKLKEEENGTEQRI